MLKTYAEIVDLLEQVNNGNDSAIDQLESSQVDWTPVVAQRLLDRLASTFNHRLKQCQDLFGKLLLNRDASVIHLEVQNLKVRLHTISRLTRLPFLPQETAAHFQDTFLRICKEMEKSLTASSNSIEISLTTLRPQIAKLPADIPAAEKSTVIIIKRSKCG